MLPALVSALHLIGLALVCTFSTLRLMALRRRDVPGIRLADNGNGIGAVFLFGAGLWRLFAELEKPLAFYTANPIFWTKIGALALIVALELYPQYVVLPWHIRHARKQPIEPRPGQLERMFRLGVLQLPLILVVTVCAALMARGIGLPASPTRLPSHPGAALYTRHCAPCHQPDGRGLDGRAAVDFVADPSILAQPDAVLLKTIDEGKIGRLGMMPGWGHILSPADQLAVLAYLRAAFAAPAAPPP